MQLEKSPISPGNSPMLLSDPGKSPILIRKRISKRHKIRRVTIGHTQIHLPLFCVKDTKSAVLLSDMTQNLLCYYWTWHCVIIEHTQTHLPPFPVLPLGANEEVRHCNKLQQINSVAQSVVLLSDIHRSICPFFQFFFLGRTKRSATATHCNK